VLKEQRIGVPLLEGVFALKEALGLEQTITIGGTECRVLLPVLGPARGRWPRHLAGPPAPGEDPELDPGWPMEGIWGDPHPGGVIIRAVGIIPVGTTIPTDEHIDFDHAVARWRHLLRDWLAVAAEGPTDFPDRDYYGATIFGSPEYDGEYDGDDVPYQPLQSGHRYRPQPLSARAWSHAIEHASAGDQQPFPLARALMTSATRAATTADWRAAIIDAATAVEVALIAGMTTRLSDEASSRVAKALFDATPMLGRRLDLAKKLDMPLPPKIREDLVERRNAVVHRGDDITGAQAKAAVAAAWKVVREYDSVTACCHEPAGRHGSLGAE
jgi:hypothetical protein